MNPHIHIQSTVEQQLIRVLVLTHNHVGVTLYLEESGKAQNGLLVIKKKKNPINMRKVRLSEIVYNMPHALG